MRIAINMEKMKCVKHETDLCIVGGGLSGLCAAIAAAREGTRVVLMQDRPVLGGNASSEIRMWVRGAKGLSNRETGIISELEEENIYYNPNLGWFEWDAILFEKVKAEKNIELLLNCSCLDAATAVENGIEHIKSVTGWQLTTYTYHTVEAKFFADCSGDSILATLCGAGWRQGREARAEYGEAMGKETADSNTMGMSLLIEATETDHPVKFIRPEWANVYKSDADFNLVVKDSVSGTSSAILKDEKVDGVVSSARPHTLGTSDTNFWWIELGGDRSFVADAEEARDELIKIAYGIWDHIKNQGDHGAENWELSWVGFLPGKRESRRYIGEYMLTENDIEAGGHFDDVIAYGGWPLDDHNPAGFRSYLTDEPASKLYPAPSPYGIPYRVLYGREVENLFFAGRNISVTHAALSSTRVMATCSLLGQALGTAASICIKDGETPHGVYLNKMDKLQSKLQDAGCMLPFTSRKMPELTLGASVNLGEGDKNVLFNGLERPGADGEINYIELQKGASLDFDFGSVKPLAELRLFFDPDFSRKSISPNKKMRVFAATSCRGKDFVPVKVASTLVKAFEVYADDCLVYSEYNNYHSLVRVPLNLSCRKLSVKFIETNGCDKVHIYSCDVQ